MKSTRQEGSLDYLAVPVALKPVDDAGALGTELQRHRREVLGGLGHDEAPNTAAA